MNADCPNMTSDVASECKLFDLTLAGRTLDGKVRDKVRDKVGQVTLGLELYRALTTLFAMAATDLDVKYVAHLARLALSPEEQKKLGAQLTHILGYIEKLREVDVSQVEPTAHAVPMVNVTRADEVRASISTEDALRNAPAKANGLFLVPKIVE